ncbi:MAG: radical SAM protein [Candidatus Hermodarchaeota archaeon]
MPIKNSVILRNEPFGGIYFNQLNGKMAMVDHEGFMALLNFKSDSLSTKQKQFTRVFFNAETPNNVEFRFEPVSKGELFPLKTSSPLIVNLAINNYCNLDCCYCYSLNEIENPRVDLSLDDLNFLLFEFRKNRVIQVAVGGGEPTLHPNFGEILRRLRVEGGIVPNYTTNGTTLTSEVLNASKKYCGAVAVSYSEERENQIDNAIRKLQKFGIQTHLNVIMLKSRIPNLAAIAEKYAKLGVSNIILLLFKPIGRGSNLTQEIPDTSDAKPLNQELIKIFSFNKKYGLILSIDACSSFIFKDFQMLSSSIGGCTSALYSCCVDYNLKMRPCSFLQHQEGIDLKKGNIKEAWNSVEFDNFRSSVNKPRFTGCSKCDYYSNCLGGCSLEPRLTFCKAKGILLSEKRNI